MNDLQIFTYQQSTVRTVERDGEPWFVLKDVCDVLGIGSPHKVADRIDEDERNQIPLTDSLGRQQETTIINESGLYNVILRSDKPEAKPFRKWVTSEVIPAIRKHGSYSRKPLTPAEQLLAQANVLVEQERRLSALEETAEKTSRAIEMIAAPAASTRDTWQEETGKAIRQMCAEAEPAKAPARQRSHGDRVQSGLQALRHRPQPPAPRDLHRHCAAQSGGPAYQPPDPGITTTFHRKEYFNGTRNRILPR